MARRVLPLVGGNLNLGLLYYQQQEAGCANLNATALERLALLAFVRQCPMAHQPTVMCDKDNISRAFLHSIRLESYSSELVTLRLSLYTLRANPVDQTQPSLCTY
eukprot:scaffold100931_cov53-Prasinocladus_malaysianus.AAC.1